MAHTLHLGSLRKSTAKCLFLSESRVFLRSFLLNRRLSILFFDLDLRNKKNTATTSSPAGSFLDLGPASPLIVQLSSRPWGASARLEPGQLPLPSSSGEESLPQRIAVLREPFSPADVSPRPLSALVARLADGAAAVASHGGDVSRRLVVDEYLLTKNVKDPAAGSGFHYALSRPGAPLTTALRDAGVRVSHAHDVSLAARSATNSARAAALGGARQSTNTVLMVSPTAFGFNAQAAEDNYFMHANPGPGVMEDGYKATKGGFEEESLSSKALREFAGLHKALTDGAGVDVCLFEHSLNHGTPDAVFPNNWFSTHAAGEAGGGVKENTLVYYPLKCPNRQAERREDAMRLLEARLGVGGKGGQKIVDLSPAERGEAPVLSGALAGVAGRRPANAGGDSNSSNGKFFEGTGVLVLDRVNGVAYVSVSERAHLELAHAWADSVRELQKAAPVFRCRRERSGKRKEEDEAGKKLNVFFHLFFFGRKKLTSCFPTSPLRSIAPFPLSSLKTLDQIGYREVVHFRSSDAHGQPIYHTNVMMAVGSDVAVVCLESVRDAKERQRLKAALEKHHEVLDISIAQVEAMCGNVLELEDGRGLPVMAMSSRAHAAFGKEGRNKLLRHVSELVHAPIDTIERVGGGSVRCSLAELF